MSAPTTTTALRWLTVSVSDTADGRPATGPALRAALDGAGLAPADVAHLKLWTSLPVTDADLDTDWAELFPSGSGRPCISVIAAQPADGAVAEITVAAAPGAQVRGVYEPGRTFPAAVVAGEHLFVAALTPADLDAGADGQAAELFGRLARLLGELGARPDDVGHLFVWYADHAVRNVVNGPFLELFTTPGDRPARHSVVRELHPGVALMIEAAGGVDAPRATYTVGGLWHGGIGGVPNSLPFGTRCGDVLFSAGTYGRDPRDGEIPDGFEAQAPWAVHHSREFLRVAGMTPSDVGQVWVWVREAADATEARKTVEAAFGSASVQVVVAALPGTNRIQIELVAQA